jgi:A/G-specific adenine glycosylase
LTEQPGFAERLLAWWDDHGRHDLPWQHPRSPYRVWVSEIMLQQTQVATVIPYFERFVQRFPATPDLASAALDDVLGLWSGLGYYARARNLHKAAQLCASKYGGDLPQSAEDLSELPGIGESTANAIVSQAHDIPAPVLDGNVRRVLARHGAVSGWTGKSAVQKELWRRAADFLPETRGADYTQAIMDLGAMVCTRSQPRCSECPVRADCQALKLDAVARYPEPKPRTRVVERSLHMLILTAADGDVLLERRSPAGIWGGLWCLPEAESRQELARELGLGALDAEALAPLEHRLTHRLLKIQPWRLHAPPLARGVKCDETRRWFTADEWPQLGLPRPVLTLLERHLTGDKT